ncbi:sulfotransferase [Thermodesulfobacteriota bacterium]
MARKRKGVTIQVVQGMTLGTLLRVIARNGFRVDTPCLGRLAYLLVMGGFNSVLGACERFYNDRDFEAVEINHPPLFIIGHWRSGTTHLHNLLNQDPSFTCPTAYQALFPHHFVFSQAGGPVFNLIAPETRPMDNVAFSADAPHEDEFALAGHSSVSPYLRVMFPVTGDNGYGEVDPHRIPREALEKWKNSLILFLKKLTLSEGKRAVLKSPPHLGRVALLLDMFPGAQFIHIVRDPYTVYSSTHKLWRDSFGRSHLQVPRPEDVDEMILSWYEELFRLFEQDRHLIPEGSLHEMKFEDLEAKPLETVEYAYQSLGLRGFHEVSPRILAYLDSIKAYKKNEHQLDKHHREKVGARWRTVFERYAYKI